MLKLMSIHQRDNKGIVKSNFVTSCLRGSIPKVGALVSPKGITKNSKT